MRGVIVTAPADPPHRAPGGGSEPAVPAAAAGAADGPPLACDFVSRFFAPGYGVAEDPVTGLAHCFLGPYWAPRVGRAQMVGYQASARGRLRRP